MGREEGYTQKKRINFNQMALSSKIHSSYSTNNVFLLCPASLTCVFSLLNSPHSCTQAHTSPPLIRQSNSVPPIHTSICFMANTILMTRNRANTMCICVQHCKDWLIESSQGHNGLGFIIIYIFMSRKPRHRGERTWQKLHTGYQLRLNRAFRWRQLKL